MSAEIDSVIEEEVNVLEAIYIHELEVKRNDSNEVTEMVLQLHPATGDNLDQQYVCMTLVLGIPVQYPNELPNIQIKNPRGIGEEEVQSTLEAMLDLSEERKGEAMLYEMIELAKESLTEGNIPRCACMICLEHFVEGDYFQKTSCYHYFHDVCLGRYVKHILNQEPEVQVAHAKPEPKKVVCPVCREEINYTEDSFPDTPVEEKFIYFPTEEMKQYQTRMATMLEKQRQCGGLIDLEAEKNKFLLKPEDVIYLNPARRLSNTSPYVSSDNLEELGSEKEDSDNKTQSGKAEGKGIRQGDKGRGRNFQGASQSSSKFGGNVRGKVDRGSRRPDVGGRSRKGYDYDDYDDRSYRGKDRDYSQRNKGNKTKRYNDYDDDDYAFMETHNQHDVSLSKITKSKGEYSKDNMGERVNYTKETNSDNRNSSGDRRTSSREEKRYSDNKSSKYQNKRNDYGHRFKEDYNRSNYGRYDRNRQGKTIRDSKNRDSLAVKNNEERANVDGGDAKSGHVDHGCPSTADSNHVSDKANDSPRTNNSSDKETDCKGNKSDKPNIEKRVQSEVQGDYSPGSKGERNNKHVDDRRKSDRPQSGRSFGRGRARRPYRDVDNSEAGGFRGKEDRNYKNRDNKNESSKHNISTKTTDRIETEKTELNDKHRMSKSNDEVVKTPSTKSSPNKGDFKHRFSKTGSRQESTKDKSNNYQRRTHKGDINNDSSEVRNGANCDMDRKSEVRGQGRGRGHSRSKNTEGRTFSKQTQDRTHNEHENHSIDKVVDKIKDLHVDTKSETKAHVDTKSETKAKCSTGASNEVFDTSSLGSKPSVPPGFCVKPPPGF